MITYACVDCGHLSTEHQNNRCAFKECKCEKMCVEITAVELEILRYCAQGLSMKEMACVVGHVRALKTIESLITTLHSKLEVHNNRHLMAMALKTGLVKLEEIPLPNIAVAVAPDKKAKSANG